MTREAHKAQRQSANTMHPPPAHPKHDRRSDERFLTVLRMALIASEDFEGLGIVRNVSRGGMMLETHRALEVGARVRVSLFDEHPREGEIVWVAETKAGMKLVRQTPVDMILAKPATLPDGRRLRPPRLRTDLPATVETIAGTLTARVEDVSLRGARLLMLSGELRSGMEINVSVAGRAPVRAATRWVDRTHSGVEFFRAVPFKELLQWLRT